MLPTSLPGRQPGRDDSGAPDFGVRRQRGQARHARRLERRAVAELGQRDVGTTVGNEHHVLHRAHHTVTPHARSLRRCVRASASSGVPVRSHSHSCSRCGMQQLGTDKSAPAPPDPADESRRRAPPRRAPPARPAPESSTSTTTARVSAQPRARCTSRSRRSSSGLDSPIALAWRVHDPNMFVAEQTGPRPHRRRPNGQLSSTPVLTVGPLSHGNEEGLLGITFSPDGTKLYVDYTDPSNNTHVDEYTMRGEAGGARRRAGSCSSCSSRSRITRAARSSPDPTGCSTSASATAAARAIRSTTARTSARCSRRSCASIPRRAGASPYSVPADNPFVGRAGARPETWMWGLRNPWRFSFDRNDRRPVDRRRRPGQVRGGRLRAPRARRASTGVGARGKGFHALPRRGCRATRATRSSRRRTPTATAPSSAVTCTAALRSRRSTACTSSATTAGRISSASSRRTDSVVAQRDLGPSVSQLTTFGEDLTASSTRSRARNRVPAHRGLSYRLDGDRRA